MRAVALLTDFGASDVFVGVMKGVILSLAPRARLIDLTHEIPPADIRAGALRLWQAAPHLPKGTVVLAVVDPGVGSTRRAVAVAAPSLACVGPDNGVFTWLLARCPGARAVELAAAGSPTFHGRDVFAPAAARLAAGVRLERLGPRVPQLATIPFPLLAPEGGGVRGEVLLADRFGNLVTSIGLLAARGELLELSPWVPGVPPLGLPARRWRVILPGGRAVEGARTFSDVPAGAPMAYIGSDGLLEIGVNRGSAAEALGLSSGAEVILVPAG